LASVTFDLSRLGLRESSGLRSLRAREPWRDRRFCFSDFVFIAWFAPLVERLSPPSPSHRSRQRRTPDSSLPRHCSHIRAIVSMVGRFVVSDVWMRRECSRARRRQHHEFFWRLQQVPPGCGSRMERLLVHEQLSKILDSVWFQRFVDLLDGLRAEIGREQRASFASMGDWGIWRWKRMGAHRCSKHAGSERQLHHEDFQMLIARKPFLSLHPSDPNREEFVRNTLIWCCATLNSSDAFALPRVAESKADSDALFFIFDIFGLDLVGYFRDGSFPQCRSPPSISVFEPSGHRMTAIPCLWMGYQSILRIGALGDDFIRRNFGLFMIRCNSSSGSPRKSCKKTMSERRNEGFPAWNHNKRGLISSVIWDSNPWSAIALSSVSFCRGYRPPFSVMTDRLSQKYHFIDIVFQSPIDFYFGKQRNFHPKVPAQISQWLIRHSVPFFFAFQLPAISSAGPWILETADQIGNAYFCFVKSIDAQPMLPEPFW